MKKNTPQAYARALYDLTQGKTGAALEKVMQNFVAILARDGKLRKANAIIEEFIHYARAQAGIVEIEIKSARELPSATINHIKKSFGEKVEATSVVKENLLGGVVVQSADKIFDASLITQLNNLKTKLAS